MIGSADRAESTVPDERRHYLAHSEVSISPRDRLVVGGILCPDTISDLEPDARVNALLPHDAALVLERTDPDLVLVESRALGAGHPWAGAGEPSVADVAWRLLRVLDVARALGRPTVLWWSGPRHTVPGLISFESRFDVVLATDLDGDRVDMAWTPGVQLARFSPVGIGRDRPFHPVAHGRWDQAPSRGIRSFLEVAAAALADDRLELWLDAEAVTGSIWLPERYRAHGVRRVVGTDLPDLYRGHGLFLAEPVTTQPGRRGLSTHTLRQLASGARVVSGPNEALSAELGEWIDWAADAAAVGDAVRSAAGLGPRTASDLRRLLRSLFLKFDTSGAVASLTRFVGVGVAMRRRNVCVVARLDAKTRPEAFVDAVTLQRHRPSEALIAAADPADAKTAIAELERAGIPARSPRPPGPERGLARWASDHASAAWLWVWPPAIEHDHDLLLDAVIAGIMTGASAIGRAHRPEDGFVDGSGLSGPIVSREAAAILPDTIDGSSTTWSDRGARVYAVGADLEER